MTLAAFHPKRAAIAFGVVLLGLAALLLLCPARKGTNKSISQVNHPINLTFLVASDTHLGLDAPEDPFRDFLKSPVPIEQRNLDMVARMNNLAGTPFPKEIGGRVETPRALLLSGDLTETGGELQWKLFTQIYGSNGRDGLLRMPVYETTGNHDHEKDSIVLDRIRQRHGDVVYSFDLGGVHFISLGEAPDDRGLAFLEKDLQGRPPSTPILLFFHLPLQGPWAENNWFGQGTFRDRLKTMLDGHRVIAIFHGHSHITSAYRWNGIDVYNPGSVKHSQRGFLVVQIQNDRMTVAEWDLDSASWWWWHQTSLKRPPAREEEVMGVQTLSTSGPRPYIEIPPNP